MASRSCPAADAESPKGVLEPFLRKAASEWGLEAGGQGLGRRDALRKRLTGALTSKGPEYVGGCDSHAQKAMGLEQEALGLL